MPAFQSLGHDLSFGHHRLTHEAMIDGMGDRDPLPAHPRECFAFTSMHGIKSLTFILGEAILPFLTKLVPLQGIDFLLAGVRA